MAEKARRRQQINVPGGGERIRQTVRVAMARLRPGTNVWFFSKPELLTMMQTVGESAQDINATMSRSEWLVWGSVQDSCVVNHDI